MEDGGRWHFGNNDLDIHVAVDIGPSMTGDGSDQEALTPITTNAAAAPVSMAHRENTPTRSGLSPPTS